MTTCRRDEGLVLEEEVDVVEEEVDLVAHRRT
jgi:hypothetical protein